MVSQTEKYQKSPQYVFTIKGTTDSIFFFFFCIPTHSDFVVYNLTVGRSDLLPLQKFSVCARGAGWWGLSTAEGVTALYLQYVFSQHDVTSSLSLICSFVGFDTLSCETVDR